MRCLHQGDQQRRPDRTDPRNLAEQFPRLVFLAFHPQIPPHLLAQEPQHIQLLVVVFSAPPYAGFPDLVQPCRPVRWCIHFLAGTRNTPTAIQRLESIHNPPEILVDRQITAGQFLQGSDAILPVIDRLEMVEAQQLGQLAGVDLVTLATFFSAEQSFVDYTPRVL